MGEQLIMLLTSAGVYVDHFIMNDATLEDIQNSVVKRWQSKLRHGHRVCVTQVVSVQQFVVSTAFHEIGSMKHSARKKDPDGLKEMMKAWDDEEDVDVMDEDDEPPPIKPKYVKKGI
ncbi:MAG TPA: hypothetical protein VF077_01050 [Nitrospiraceae bacterium]